MRHLYYNTNFYFSPAFSGGLEQQAPFKFATSPSFNDPAIMSARFASPVLAPAVPEGYQNASTMLSSQLAYGPPPGLAYAPGIFHNPVPPTNHTHGSSSNIESQTNGSSTHGEFFPHLI
jgi:CCR4-NOT transcription complex subunit 4